MGIKINFKNQRKYKGEKITDIEIKSPKTIKAINCPTKLNSSAIDEFLVIFLVFSIESNTIYKIFYLLFIYLITIKGEN